MKPAPRTIPIVPSVAMNGGNWTAMTSTEIKSPVITPTSRPATMLGGMLQPPSTSRPPVTTLASAMTAPGDKSMPPEMITMAAPIAAMP